MPAPETTPAGSSVFTPGRRTVLKGLAAGTAGIAAFPLLAACTGATKKASTGTHLQDHDLRAPTPPTPCRRRPTPPSSTAFEKSSGDTVTINTVDHNSFQNNDQQLPPGQPGPGLHLVRRLPHEATTPPRAWSPRSTTSGPRSARTTSAQGIQTASTGDDGKKYFVPNYNYPWAIFYRKSRLAGQGLRGARHLRRAQDPVRADEEGRPHPDRLRRQGPLAGLRHVRLPQHAPQRLPVPRRPDGAQGELGPAEGQGRVRQLEGAAALPGPGRARPDLAGSRPDAGAARSPACTCSDPSSPSSSPTRPCWPTSTSSRSRRSTEANGQDAVEAPIDGFMLSKKGGDNGAALALRGVLRHGGRRRTPTQAVDPSNVATNKQADTSAYSAPEEEGAADHRQRQVHLAVPRPRLAAGLRQQRDGSRAAELHQVRELRHQERRGAGQVPVRRPVADRRSGRRMTARRSGTPARRSPAPRPPYRQRGACGKLDQARQDRAGPDGRHPDADRGGPDLVPDAAVRRAVVHQAGTACTVQQSALRPERRTTTSSSTTYPPFWPAIEHNVLWLVFLSLVATPLGLLLAVLLDQQDPGQQDLPDRVLHPGDAVAGAGRHHLAADVRPRRTA